MKQELIRLLKQVIAMLFTRMTELKREVVYTHAKACIGKDMSPVHNEYGCAEAVNNVVKQVLGYPVGGDVSTYRMYEELKKSTRFKMVASCLRGDIILSPTGFGSGKLSNGHVGIVSDNERIMSNNSQTSLWDEHWTLEKWKEYYGERGGYPVTFWRPL